MDPVFIKILVALLPVVVFLAGFTMLDAFHLIGWRWLTALVAAGGVLAAICYLARWAAMDELPIGRSDYTRYAAPVVEETMKGAMVLLLFARNRIGFMIDAAISGFAIGAGFSLVENVIYLHDYVGVASLGVWLVRGFGTAVMHGAATAAFGVIGQWLTERQMRIEGARYRFHALAFVPGLIAAILIHGLYNHFPDQPILSMAVVLVVAPMSLVLVFSKSEHAAHRWLVHEYETHEHMLQDIRDGRYDTSEAGRFVLTLSERFSPQVVAEAFEYLKLHTQLMADAEQTLIAREEGTAAPAARDVRAEFDRLHALEKHIGRSALMAIRPHLQLSRHELWEMHELQHETGTN